LYGSRAANGVVLITTKAGKSGKAKINFTYQKGYNNNTLAPDQKTLNTDEYVQYYKEGWLNSGKPASSFDSLLSANGVNRSVNTDWFNEVLRQGQYSQYNLNASGGTEKNTYFISGSYYKSDATTKGIDYDKATFRVNVNSELTKKLSLKAGFSGSFQRTSNFLGGSFFANPIRAMYRLAPWLPVYKSDGATYELGYNSGYNPVAVIETTNRNAKTYNFSANTSAKYEIAKGLTFEGTYALDFNHAFKSIYYDPRVGNLYIAVGGAIENYTQDINNWVATNIIRYKKDFNDKNSFEAFAGYEAQKRTDVDISIEVNGIAPGTSTPAGGSSPVLTTGTGTGNSLISKFLNTNYSYDDRFFVSGSVREDASSRFARNFRSAIFWSVGAGWNIHNESFFKSNWVNELKLRASYGYTGNQGIDNFESQGLYSAGSDYNLQSGLSLNQLSNDNLTWEKNIPLNIGLDFSVLKGRISGSVEWYDRLSSNLLISQSIPSLNGVTSITVNKNDFYTHYQRGYAGVNPVNGEALWYTSSAKDATTNVFTTALPRIAHGSALPKFYTGMTNSFSYHDFKLSFQLYAYWGNTIYDEYGYLQKTDANLGFSDQSNGLSKYEYARRWTAPGQITDVPKPVFLGTQSSAGSYESSRFLYDGSYIRLRDITLSYNLPKSFLAKAKLNTARVYVRGQNLFTYTVDKRFNTDPEVSIDGTMSQRPPVFSTILFGLDINF